VLGLLGLIIEKGKDLQAMKEKTDGMALWKCNLTEKKESL
jgi:hypothetical protein